LDLHLQIIKCCIVVVLQEKVGRVKSLRSNLSRRLRKHFLQLLLRKASSTTAFNVKPKRILGLPAHRGQHTLPPPRMIFLLHPHSTLLQRANCLLENLELHLARSYSTRFGGNDDIPFPLLGRGKSKNLPVSFPLRYEQAVRAIDEHPCQVLLANPKVFPANCQSCARRTLPWGYAGHYRRWAHPLAIVPPLL